MNPLGHHYPDDYYQPPTQVSTGTTTDLLQMFYISQGGIYFKLSYCWDPSIFLYFERLSSRNVKISVPDPDPNPDRSTGSTCFWASRIRIRIH
jgi:hypothetical protein